MRNQKLWEIPRIYRHKKNKSELLDWAHQIVEYDEDGEYVGEYISAVIAQFALKQVDEDFASESNYGYYSAYERDKPDDWRNWHRCDFAMVRDGEYVKAVTRDELNDSIDLIVDKIFDAFSAEESGEGFKYTDYDDCFYGYDYGLDFIRALENAWIVSDYGIKENCGKRECIVDFFE